MDEIVTHSESVQLYVPLYDKRSGDFVRLERSGDTIRSVDVFSGDVVDEMDVGWFKEEDLAMAYKKIPTHVVEERCEVLYEVLQNALSAPGAGYSTISIRFVMKACECNKKELH